MSSQSEVELQQLMSHIMNGESHLEQLRQALVEPLLNKWHLQTYHDVPKTRQGPTLFAWAIQNKNTVALDLLMKNLGLEFLPDEHRVKVKAEKSNLLYIAVEYYHEPTWNFVLQRIDIERAFEQLGKKGTTVLHAAANRNIADIFRALDVKVGNALKDKLLETRDGLSQTVLHAAASKMNHDEDASQRCYDTVIELLRIQPRLIDIRDRTGETVFHKVVTANQKHVLQHLLMVDATILSKCDKNNDSAYSFFLKKRGQSNHIRRESRKDPEILKSVSRTLSFDEEIGSILHKAILGLDELNISTRRRLLFKDGGVGPELKWDLSIFNNKKLNFTEYLRILESNNLNISFYETLIRVTLPDLSCSGNRSCDATTHGLRKSSEANVIFSHLKSKGVKHIIEAVVPDCMVHPHANRHIVNALRSFNITRLKWRKLDLGVKTIAMAAPDVEVLTLYSSGDRDALSQWVDIDGLCQLPKLHKIHITILRGEDEDADLENTRRHCEETLLGHRSHNHNDLTLRMVRDNGLLKIEHMPCSCQTPRFHNSHIKVELEPVPVPSRKPDERLPLHEYHLGEGTLFDRLSPLREFISGLNADSRDDIYYLKQKPIKVAVLDSGICADSGLFPALTGASFIEDITTTDSHWHTSTNHHGTMMASLIRKLDPTCHIYAARTHHGPDMQGGDVNATIKALKWAVSHTVDVICISWTCAEGLDLNDFGDLEEMIMKAANNSLIFCATGDKGPSAKKSYPAGFKNPFKICSCSISGQPSHNAEVENTEFYVPAEDLDVALPKYLILGDKEKPDGSSAATAIAAGLATIVLSLARFAYYELEDDSSATETDDSDNSDIKSDYSGHISSPALLPEVQKAESRVRQLKRRSIMERVFQHMCCNSDKFVQPWEVFPMDLVGLEIEKAKKSVADFLERASGRKV